MTPERKPFRPLTSSDVCEIYKLLYSSGLVSFPITAEAESKVDAIIANINATYFGVERYKQPEEKAAAYLYFLIKGHAFTDGNKRTAVLFFKVFCEFNHLTPSETEVLLDELAIYIEQSKKDHQNMITLIAALLFGGDFLKRR